MLKQEDTHGLKLTVFTPRGYNICFSMIFPSVICISILPMLGYKYFELIRMMNRMMTYPTLSRVACKISLGKIMVQIESNMADCLLIPPFSKRLEKSIVSICKGVQMI